MINSIEGISASRAKALTERERATSNYICYLEALVEHSISNGEYRASINVRDDKSAELACYWRDRGFLVEVGVAENGYRLITVDWSSGGENEQF